jgi:SNF2 family DNA or RNA helicase
MLERQWNPANEEQAEARFPRPEGIKTDFIDGVYMVAIGTVDEFFSEIVERKREIVGKTLDGKAAEWDQSSLIKELAETLSLSGGRRWSI